jgi:UDP-N-acetyl-D-galactosamine dehydrogenase
MEVEPSAISGANRITYTNDEGDLTDCTVYIVTVPTPVDRFNRPDLAPLLEASETVGALLRPFDVVIYESTVYPGATEEDCVPVLEAISGLTFNQDFFVGYSPERVNPGDQVHRLETICKVTSGSTPEIAQFVDQLYRMIVTAGTHLAPSLKVAEASKVIENTQRDLNIALMNELALIFDRLGINTLDVLEAAETKWNFLPFKPGLVGGHCISVDPYYLTHKAQSVGYNPSLVLAGRRVNDRIGPFVASRLVKEMIRRDVPIKGSRCLVMGLAFKENCPDLRNTGVVDLIKELGDYGVDIAVHDPWVNSEEVTEKYGLNLTTPQQGDSYDSVLIAVAHLEFKDAGLAVMRSYGRPGAVLMDLKGIFRASPDGDDVIEL